MCLRWWAGVLLVVVVGPTLAAVSTCTHSASVLLIRPLNTMSQCGDRKDAVIAQGTQCRRLSATKHSVSSRSCRSYAPPHFMITLLLIESVPERGLLSRAAISAPRSNAAWRLQVLLTTVQSSVSVPQACGSSDAVALPDSQHPQAGLEPQPECVLAHHLQFQRRAVGLASEMVFDVLRRRNRPAQRPFPRRSLPTLTSSQPSAVRSRTSPSIGGIHSTVFHVSSRSSLAWHCLLLRGARQNAILRLEADSTVTDKCRAACAAIALIPELDNILPNPAYGVTLFAPSNDGVNSLLSTAGAAPDLHSIKRTHRRGNMDNPSRAYV